MLYRTKSVIKAEKRKIARLLKSYRSNATKLNIGFSLTMENFYPMVEDINFQCPILGVKIDMTKSAPHFSSLAIARFDTTKGYHANNVTPCSYKAKLARGASDWNTYHLTYNGFSRLHLERYNRAINDLG